MVLREALRSAMEQDYGNIEILIVDNHSGDNTQQVVAEISAGDARVQYVRHSENIGMARNFSACISLARGKYIKLLCADDILVPGCVAAMAGVLEEYPEISLAGCARILTDERLSPLRTASARRMRARIGGQAMIRECFFLGNIIGEPTAVMFRRVDAQRGFNEGYSQLVDLEMWFHLLQKGDFSFIPAPLCGIRQHADQATQVNLRQGRIVEDKCRLFRDFVPALGSMNLIQEFLWDGRMALSLARAKRAGKIIESRAINEVFFRRVFSRLTCPAVAMLLRLGLVGGKRG